MTMPVDVQVGAEDMEPLGTQFNINYVEPIEEDGEGAGANDDIPPVSQLDFPPIYGIYEEDWDTYAEPFDQDTPVRIVGAGHGLKHAPALSSPPLNI